MTIQQAERRLKDLQTQLLTEQISALRADTAKARSEKEEATAATASTGDAELEKLKRLPYCPYAEVNPFPTRPDTLTDFMPKLFDLYGDKTHAALSKKPNSSMKYEQMVLGPALAYFHAAKAIILPEEATVDLLQNLPEAEYTPFLEELWDRMLRGHNTKKGVYGLLCNRNTMMGDRSMLEGDDEAHGGADAVRVKLAFMEQKIYAGTKGMVVDTVLTKWLAEFDNSKAKSENDGDSEAAGGGCCKPSTTQRPPSRRSNSVRYRSMYVVAKEQPWRAGGASSEALQWTGRGAKMRWVKGPPPKFDHGTSLRDMTQQQQEWLDIETDRALQSGAWCGALPFGWTDSPQIFVKLTKTLVELICSPQAGENRHEVKKLRDGQEVRRCWAVRRREGELRRGSDRAGARVFPYMDDFMVITKTQDDAFVQRDRVSKLLPRLGLFRNEKKGHWEPTQLVEHLGLEVDFKEGLFRVTERRLKKIHSKATAILCRATRERRWVQARELARYIRSEANQWADRLSRDKDLDEWRINGRWFKYAEEQWGEHSVDRFASEISAQLPRQGNEEINKPEKEVRPGCKIEVFLPEDQAWYPGIVGATATVQLYTAALQKAGTVKGTSLQPYLPAIKCFHKDFSFQGAAKGRAVARAVKGMTAMQTAAAEQQNVTETHPVPPTHSAVPKVQSSWQGVQPLERDSEKLEQSAERLAERQRTEGQTHTKEPLVRNATAQRSME
eukprot:gene34015-biopygen3239